MLPFAPPMFSITTGRPRTLRMDSARMRATASNRPAAGYGTTIVIGRVGYVCAPAIPDIAGSAATPAARCRKFRRGSFTRSPRRRGREARRDGEADRLGCCHVDDQLNL